VAYWSLKTPVFTAFSPVNGYPKNTHHIRTVVVKRFTGIADDPSQAKEFPVGLDVVEW